MINFLRITVENTILLKTSNKFDKMLIENNPFFSPILYGIEVSIQYYWFGNWGQENTGREHHSHVSAHKFEKMHYES